MNFERTMLLTISKDGKSVIITNIDGHFDNIKDSLSDKDSLSGGVEHDR